MNTPTTEQIREIYVRARAEEMHTPKDYDAEEVKAGEDFDSWLSTHDDEVGEKAIEDYKTNEAWQEYL